MPLIGFGLLQSQPQSVQVISYQGSNSFEDVSVPLSGVEVIFTVLGTGLIDVIRAAQPDLIGTASYVQNANPSFDSADYDFRFDITSGFLSGGPYSGTGIWIAGSGLGTQATWGVEELGTGVASVNGNFRVRPSGGGADLITQALSFTAEATP